MAPKCGAPDPPLARRWSDPPPAAARSGRRGSKGRAKVGVGVGSRGGEPGKGWRPRTATGGRSGGRGAEGGARRRWRSAAGWRRGTLGLAEREGAGEAEGGCAEEGGGRLLGGLAARVFLQKDMDGGFDYKQAEGSFCKKAKERPDQPPATDRTVRVGRFLRWRHVSLPGEGSAERAPSPRRIEVRVYYH
jgi:hypothetical protein